MRRLLLVVAAWTAAAGAAAAATMPKAYPPPAHFASVEGEVDRFTTRCEGEIDGFYLSDGTRVRIPDDAWEKLAAMMSVGEEVKVEGTLSVVDGVNTVDAVVVTDKSSQRGIAVAPLPSPIPPTKPGRCK